MFVYLLTGGIFSISFPHFLPAVNTSTLSLILSALVSFFTSRTLNRFSCIKYFSYTRKHFWKLKENFLPKVFPGTAFAGYDFFFLLLTMLENAGAKVFQKKVFLNFLFFWEKHKTKINKNSYVRLLLFFVVVGCCCTETTLFLKLHKNENSFRFSWLHFNKCLIFNWIVSYLLSPYNFQFFFFWNTFQSFSHFHL